MSALWLFEDWPEDTLGRDVQVLRTAWLHLTTRLIWRPLRRLLRLWKGAA